MIRPMIADLVRLDDALWDSYAMCREPLIGKITPEQKEEFLRGAHLCGEKLADGISSEAPGTRPEAYAESCGVTVEHAEEAEDGAMFACFTEPDRITVYQKTIESAQSLIAEQGLEDILGDIRVEDVLLAHELYHYLEYARPGVYTGRKLLRLWKIGKFQNWSKVVSLQEIGAMAFTRRLLGLPYSPYVFDVLLLYTRNKRMSKELYEGIVRLARMGEEKRC